MKRRQFTKGLVASVLATPLLPSLAQAIQTSQSIKVSGPITGGRHGYPFCSYAGDLSHFGYVEEEYFIEGTATRYQANGELGFDGKWSVEPMGTYPFKTRLLVRRPQDHSRFNGTVVTEWLNTTAGHDTCTIGMVTNGLYQNGFVYVGVSCQEVGITGVTDKPQGLHAWDPQRYGSLSIPGDSISYDIFSQAGKAVGPNRSRQGVDPLAGLKVKQVIATGASQSGGRLRTYINAIHLRDKVFDGFLPTIQFGAGYAFSDITVDKKTGAPAKNRELYASLIRDDLKTPVFMVNSETEVLVNSRARQPDSDYLRFWEVAGASHVPAGWDRIINKIRERDGLYDSGPAELGSEVLWQDAADAALMHLISWIDAGKLPPVAEPIKLSTAEGKPVVMRDEFGNAKGGLRLPELEAPIATYDSALQALNAANGLRGTTTPLTAGTLKALYPTHQDYVDKVTAAAKECKSSGYILAPCLGRYIEQAKQASLAS
ncbi:alpha/beta hydrolase domain-containing protein [Alteromonas lipolytica]|uniref:Alpha/beta hydrolase domain-containing protein n=1 Tax=Alteromonas lipolytica TaxID=1856405 RepID=A0A1E8FC62_9ALTE|nr:alpha/beta hydrolase domain-containing protein [Alteromonas lipolytica]OFI33512.1 hypothetical protein BFC17_04445 [Alteromonas lipolytica]GGF59006.1 hypothetical protein GCM10011338_09110 [Alteromonas lipolytica]